MLPTPKRFRNISEKTVNWPVFTGPLERMSEKEKKRKEGMDSKRIIYFEITNSKGCG